MAAGAARLREEGKHAEARAQFFYMQKVARVASLGKPDAAILREEESYERDVAAVDRGGGAASKKLKEKAFNAVRAPVEGW
jgi:hypothetical protein